MRQPLDKSRLERFLRELGAAAAGPGRVYLCGGATALLVGWRESTVDVDIQFDPEPEGIFAAIAKLKNALDINIEIAGPSDFVPPLPGWRGRCVHICWHGQVEFLHYDPCTQALSKILRGHQRDLDDVQAMVRHGLLNVEAFAGLFEQVRPALVRYPAIDENDLAKKVAEFVDATR